MLVFFCVMVRGGVGGFGYWIEVVGVEWMVMV